MCAGMVVVNLPVRDPIASGDFYRALGFDIDEEYCEEEAVAVRLAPAVVVMLLSRERFGEFVGPGLAGRVPTPSLTSLGVPSRALVDALHDTALAHGGSSRSFVTQGPLYARSFADPDGHVWEVLHMADDAAARDVAEPPDAPGGDVAFGTPGARGAT